MLRREFKRERQRQRQAAYEARLRDGVALYRFPLGTLEIDALVTLGWLQEGAETDRDQVGAAVAGALREMATRPKTS